MESVTREAGCNRAGTERLVHKDRAAYCACGVSCSVTGLDRAARAQRDRDRAASDSHNAIFLQYSAERGVRAIGNHCRTSISGGRLLPGNGEPPGIAAGLAVG